MPEHPLLLSFLPSPSLSPALPTTLSYVFFRLFRRPASTVCSTRASPSNKRSLSPSPPPPPPRARSALFPLYVLICGSPTHLDSMGYFWGCIPPASPSPLSTPPPPPPPLLANRRQRRRRSSSFRRTQNSRGLSFGRCLLRQPHTGPVLAFSFFTPPPFTRVSGVVVRVPCRPVAAHSRPFGPFVAMPLQVCVVHP